MRIISATPTGTLLHATDGAMLDLISSIAWAEAMESVLNEGHITLRPSEEEAARRVIKTLKDEDDECEARKKRCN